MLKEEINVIVENIISKLDENDMNIIVSDLKEISLIYENKDFRFICNDLRCLVKWLKAKSYFFFIETKKFNNFYKFVKNCVDNGIDYKEELNKSKKIEEF